MSLDIDTQTIKRLRDALIESGRLQEASEAKESPNKIDDRQQASIDRVAPFAETMYLMMMADGDAAEAEKDAIRGALLMLTHGFLESSILDGMLQRCELAAEEQGVEFRLQSIGAHLSADRQDRETAFTLAAAVAVADNQVAEEESTLIESIAEWYGISSKRSDQILRQIEQPG